jgi:hypothetical protein
VKEVPAVKTVPLMTVPGPLGTVELPTLVVPT